MKPEYTSVKKYLPPIYLSFFVFVGHIFIATVYERETETGSCRHHFLRFKVMLSFLEGFNGIIWFAVSYRY